MAILNFLFVISFIIFINLAIALAIYLFRPVILVLKIFWPFLVGLAIGALLINNEHVYVGITIIGFGVFVNLFWLMHLDLV